MRFECLSGGAGAVATGGTAPRVRGPPGSPDDILRRFLLLPRQLRLAPIFET
jgi:hypothetical protein